MSDGKNNIGLIDIDILNKQYEILKKDWMNENNNDYLTLLNGKIAMLEFVLKLINPI